MYLFLNLGTKNIIRTLRIFLLLLQSLNSNTMKKLIACLFFGIIAYTAYAQNETHTYRDLPYQATSEEQRMLPTWYEHVRSTMPPPGPVTAISEFQPMSGVMVAYPGRFGVPMSLLREISQIAQLKVLVYPASDSNTVKSLLTSNGVNMANVKYWVINHDSYWTRDYGPWFILDGNDQISVVDFTYNRPSRPYDDAAMIQVANKMQVNRYEMPLVHTGGNYMVNGYGTAASTDLVEEENNNLSTADIQTLVSNYLGIDDYMLFPDPQGEYIAHVDCWGKFLGVDKVLIAQVSTTNSNYNKYEEIANTFANSFSPWGNRYQVFRIYMPSTGSKATPYTNSLILNDHVFVPITGSQWDNDAIATYEQAMPGYTIVPVMQSNMTPWLNTDALHCRTHELADVGMLYIRHYPVLGSQSASSPIEITAEIKALSGQSFVCDSLLIYFRINNGNWQCTQLDLVSGDQFRGQLNVQSGDEVDYYLFAKDQSGRRECHPYIGAADPHHFSVAPLGIQSSIDEKVAAYPNPCTNWLVLQHAQGKLSTIRVTDIYGRIILEETCHDDRTYLNTAHWTPGVYMVTITDQAGRTCTKKIIKK